MGLDFIFSSTQALILLVAGILGIVLYVFLVFKPDVLAKWLLFFFSFFLPTDKYPAVPFWNLLDDLKRRRRIMISLLAISFVFFFVTDFYLLYDYIFNYLLEDTQVINLLIIFGFLIYGALSTKEFFKIGSVDIPEIDHPRLVEAEKVVETLSIASGIKQPEIKIIASTNPTSFAVAKFFEYPQIYITTQLLYLTDREELAGVLGHEMAHIISSRTQDFTLISILTYCLKISSYFFFVLILLLINPYVAAGWISLLASVTLRSIRFAAYSQNGDYSKAISLILSFLNPPYVLLNFTLITLYYLFTSDEDFYADIISVQLNRNAQGLYSILEKLRDYDQIKQSLPENLSQLYFTLEAAPENSITIQPDIQTRLEVLTSIDSFAPQTKPDTVVILKCPYCKNEMKEISVPTFYGSQVKVNRCPVCFGVWFDTGELWVVADLTTLEYQTETAAPLQGETSFLCPKCQVQLQKDEHPMIPSLFQVYQCPVCKGNFIDEKDLLGFGAYRKKYLADQKNT